MYYFKRFIFFIIFENTAPKSVPYYEKPKHTSFNETFLIVGFIQVIYE